MRARCCRRAVPGRLDDRIRDRIIAETRGNPLALVELSQRMSPSERAGGFPPARGERSSESARGAVRAASRRIARGDAATDPAGGSGAARGRRAAVAGGRTALHRPGRACSRDGSRAAGDRRPRPVSPPAGALGGVPSRVTRRTTARARRAGGGERSRARRRQPRVAPGARGRRAGRSRGRRPRALRRARAEPRRARRRSGVPRASDRADPRPRRSRPSARWPPRRRASRPASSRRRSGSWPRRKAARSTASSAREPRFCAVTLPPWTGTATRRPRCSLKLRNGSSRSTSASPAGPT